MRREHGQATVEWTGVVLLVLVLLAGAFSLAVALDAAWLGHRIRCALLVTCHGEDARLETAYGAERAGFVRAYAPGIVYEPGTLTLPVDFRNCRAHSCADAPDLRGYDVWRSDSGRQATVFTHLSDLRAAGGDLYIQYWLYYPDSTYNGPAWHVNRATRGGILAYTPAGLIAGVVAGHHDDDWESYQVRISGSGRVLARASAHNGYSGHKRWPNTNELPNWAHVKQSGAWTPVTGWTRVSRGSHAGHIVDGPANERRTAADGVAIVPIETLSSPALAHRFAVIPPWLKPVYADPRRTDT